MNLPISVLAVLCLSSFGRAQICDPTNMDFHCRGWKKANDSLGAELCYGYPDIGQLSFERGPDSANDCCTGDEVTGSTCNYPSYDSMMSECQQFCGGAGQSSVPVVVGSSTFGVDLSSATQLCLHPEITGGYDASRYERCESNADAIEEIEDASVSFLHKMRRFSYAVLEFKAGLLEQVDRIKEQIQDPDRLREIQDAARDQKILLIIEIYREALHTEDFPGKGALLRSVEDLKATANKLKEVMDRETGRLTTFLEECNGFFPKPDTFLRDVCKVTGPSCIDEDQGEHVSCCCFDNLVANMHGGEEFLDNSPPSRAGRGAGAAAAALWPDDADQGQGRLRRDVHGVCGGRGGVQGRAQAHGARVLGRRVRGEPEGEVRQVLRRLRGRRVVVAFVLG